MYASLPRSNNLATEGKHGMQTLMPNPVGLSTIPTPFEKRQSCGEFYVRNS